MYWNADLIIYRLQENDTYFDISDVHSNPPAPEIPQPFHSNSNGPTPSVRRQPPPPVPRKKANKAGSSDNLNKLDLSQSLHSSQEQPQRTSRTFSVVDIRKYVVIDTSILSRVILTRFVIQATIFS